MTAAVAAFILVVVFATSVMSGVFGMAGGVVLLGALALVLPVSAAFVTHGLIQIVANGGRALLHRRHVRWPIVGLYGGGALAAGIAVASVDYAPSKALIYLLLGLMPALAWLPKDRLPLDAARPVHAVACGLSVTGLNLLAGVAGPMLDVFFVRTALTRHQIVATKAATQVLSHLAKVVVFGAPLLAPGAAAAPPLWLFALAFPLSVAGTVAGGRILDCMTDKGFLAWSKWILTAIGAAYLVQAARLYAA